MEKKVYRSKALVKNARTGENVPKWELEEEHHSDGSRYFIHYYSPKGHYEIIQVNSHFQYGNRHLQYLSENHPERIQKHSEAARQGQHLLLHRKARPQDHKSR